MDINDISDWVSQPNVCRCCLSASGTLDLTAAFITDTGAKEVFINVLQDCFSVSLSYMDEMNTSHLACEPCVSHLRNASNFRKQVLLSDKCFSNYWKVLKDDKNSTRSETGSFIVGSETKINQKANMQRKIHILESSNNFDYDSDTPIAEIRDFTVNMTSFSDNVKCTKAKKSKLKGNEDEVEINLTDQPTVKVQLKKSIKKVTERKRLIITCNIVLMETTACPFRHHKSWFQCFFCTKDFIEISLLRNHITQSHPNVEVELKKIKRYPRSLQIEISNLECHQCQCQLTDVKTMVEHFVEKHNKLMYKECIVDYKINSSPYTCHLCAKEFHVFRTLTTHLNEHYTNCICDVCGKPFLNSKRLKVHKKIHEKGNYPCSACDKVLKTKTSQSNHMESAHSKRIIKCQICSKPMKHYNYRIKHMSEVHNITHKFKCPICDKEYNIKHYLATHMRQTHGHKNKKCTMCSMAFITNHSLKKHMSKHTGERPFTCGVCCKSYARNYTLREHMRSHENDKLLIS